MARLSTNLYNIFVRSPIDKKAANVVSQRYVEPNYPDLNREELKEIVVRLQRKSQLLKVVLQIKNKSQHKNLKYRDNRGRPTLRSEREPRAVQEYRRVGEQIQRMESRIGEINRERKAARTGEALW